MIVKMQPSSHYEPVILGVAFLSLVIGLGLNFRITSKNIRNSQTIHLISWLLIALFPVLLIYSFFPSNKTEGALLGFSLSGAIAAFIFIWWYGTKQSINAQRIDELQIQVQEQNKTIENLRRFEKKPDSRKITDTKVISYRFRRIRSKRIALITGDLQNVNHADIWVSSENTNMQMARFYDRSISAVIRYMGATKDERGNVTSDFIAIELAKVMGDATIVEPATVLITSSGEELRKKNNVKLLFHVAAVQGEIGCGYSPIRTIEACITRSLQRADSDQLKESKLKSILFPLFGTGTGNGDPEEIIGKLLQAAVSYIEANCDSRLETVFFVVSNQIYLEICRSILEDNSQLELMNE